MSFIKDITLDSGIEVKNAIHKVESVIVTNSKMTFVVRVYKDEGKPAFHEFTKEGVYSGGNVFDECYLILG